MRQRKERKNIVKIAILAVICTIYSVIIINIGELINIFTIATTHGVCSQVHISIKKCFYFFEKVQTPTFFKLFCSIDATAEDGTLGRLLNHSRSGNCKTKVHVIKEKPHLIFVTTREVKTGEELTYDYGDRSKDSLQSHPWLKS